MSTATTLPSVAEVVDYFRRLFPITRSITGDGNRETLRILSEITDLHVMEVPSGTPVYDWVVPREWNIRAAWIKNQAGERIVDFAVSNLHVLSYSVPVSGVYRLKELRDHLHYFPDQPSVIPYRTSYYYNTWGFCLSYDQFLALFDEDEAYEVYIDASFSDGAMTLADVRLPGASSEEFFFSTYFCHPSMANDNLSGILLGAFLARSLRTRSLRHSYRFIFVPETIGAIAYCALHEQEMHRMSGGLVLSCVAGPGPYGYKRTFRGDHRIDAAVQSVFRRRAIDPILYPFEPQGSDERQYSSPGFRIPVGSVHRNKYHEYASYHTSGDDLSYINYEGFVEMLSVHLEIIEKLDRDTCFTSLNPHGEPRLGRRGLYPTLGRRTMKTAAVAPVGDLDVMLWLLFYADGRTSVLEICERHGFPEEDVRRILEQLQHHGLLTVP